MGTTDSTDTPEIAVSVTDMRGEAVAAVVNVSIGGIRIGSLHLSADRQGSIQIPYGVTSVELEALFLGERLKTSVTRNKTSYEFVFNVRNVRTVIAPIAEARCADGTTGSPCVICKVQGIGVRLCVWCPIFPGGSQFERSTEVAF